MGGALRAATLTFACGRALGLVTQRGTPAPQPVGCGAERTASIASPNRAGWLLHPPGLHLCCAYSSTR